MVLHSMYWKESSFLSSSSPFKPSLLGHSWPHKNENSQEREPRGSYCLCWLVARRRGPLAPRGTLAAAGHTRVRWSTRRRLTMAVFNNALVALLVLLMVCKLAPEASNSTCHSVISVSLLLLWVLSPVAASYMSMTQNRNLRAEKLCCCCCLCA